MPFASTKRKTGVLMFCNPYAVHNLTITTGNEKGYHVIKIVRRKASREIYQQKK